MIQIARTACLRTYHRFLRAIQSVQPASRDAQRGCCGCAKTNMPLPRTAALVPLHLKLEKASNCTLYHYAVTKNSTISGLATNKYASGPDGTWLLARCPAAADTVGTVGRPGPDPCRRGSQKRTRGCGSKNGTRNGTLVYGKKDLPGLLTKE